MKKNIYFTVISVATAVLASIQIACSQNKKEDDQKKDSPPTSTSESTFSPEAAVASGLKSKLKKNAAYESDSVLWETKTAVSTKRQIEVGDHPSIVLETFKIGQREHKVRFFVADDQRALDLVSNSPQDNLLRKDVGISKAENSKWSLFGLVVHAPSFMGLQKFSDSSMFNGLAVSPQLMICASEGLKHLKIAGDKTPRVFQNWQIDTMNIFVKPVQHANEAESKMSIDPKLKALNFQLSVWTRSGDCFLPSSEEIAEALGIADQRIHE